MRIISVTLIVLALLVGVEARYRKRVDTKLAKIDNEKSMPLKPVQQRQLKSTKKSVGKTSVAPVSKAVPVAVPAKKTQSKAVPVAVKKTQGKATPVAVPARKKKYRTIVQQQPKIKAAGKNATKPSVSKAPVKPVVDPMAEAEAYMASLKPLTVSGDKELLQLIASPEESRVAKPYDPIKFVKARHNLLNGKVEEDVEEGVLLEGKSEASKFQFSYVLAASAILLTIII